MIIFITQHTSNLIFGGIAFYLWAKGKSAMPYSKKRRVWLVEDNIVALYIALHGHKDLDYDINEIKSIIPHKGFSMRIQNYKAIKTNGKEGLTAGLNSPLFKKIFNVFSGLSQKKFSDLVNSILKTKEKVRGDKAF